MYVGDLLSVIVQLLKCSPQLEYLVVTHAGDVLGPLLSMVQDPRYHVRRDWCSVPEPDYARACFRCLGWVDGPGMIDVDLL